MNPRVVTVHPNSDYTLTLIFTSGEIKVFDISPYLSVGIFQKLRDKQRFNSVRPFLGSI